MIQLFHVTKRYGPGPPALFDVNLAVGKGELVFLTGPSGAGKSTLLRLLYGAERPTSGQVLVAGRNLTHIRGKAVASLRRRLGVVFQDFKLLPGRTVAENVVLALDVTGVPRRQGMRRVEAVLAQVGLAQKAHSYPLQLSGGEQQRVAIARALVNDPLVLLADEPTGNLDPVLTLEILDLLCEFSARGTAVIVATHDAGLVARYQRRTLVLSQGRLVHDGAPSWPSPEVG